MTNKKSAATRFEEWLTFRSFAPGSIRDYLHCFNQFANSLPEDTDFFNLDVQLAIDYVFALRKKGLSPASINLYSSALRCYYDVILDRPISIRRLPNAKYTPPDPAVLRQSEIDQLLSAGNVRMKAFILLGYDCGLRVSEVSKLRVKDIDSEKMLLHIVNSKRNKSRYVKMSQSCLNALREYWKVYRPDPSGYMFPGKDGNPISAVYISHQFRHLVLELRLRSDEKIRFHNLRDTYATSMRDNGCDVFTLRKSLGHSSLKSTARYIAISTSDIEEMKSPSDFWSNSHD